MKLLRPISLMLALATAAVESVQSTPVFASETEGGADKGQATGTRDAQTGDETDQKRKDKRKQRKKKKADSGADHHGSGTEQQSSGTEQTIQQETSEEGSGN